MTTRTRYFLLQIPGWVLTAILLAALYRWMGLPGWAAALLWAGYVAKDFLLYPYLRRAYETHSPSGAARLIGERGVVKKTLAPEGYVLIHGELWQARERTPAQPLPVGTHVRVEGAEGMVLIVVRESQPSQPAVSEAAGGTVPRRAERVG